MNSRARIPLENDELLRDFNRLMNSILQEARRYVIIMGIDQRRAGDWGMTHVLRERFALAWAYGATVFAA